MAKVFYVDWNLNLISGEEIGRTDSNSCQKVAIKTSIDIHVAEVDRVFIKRVNAQLFILNKLNEQLNKANTRVVEAMAELSKLHETIESDTSTGQT